MTRDSLQKIFSRENLAHIEAWVGILTFIAGIIIAVIQIKETEKLDRVSKAIDYCNMYQANSEIVNFATKTFETSRAIEKINGYNEIFKADKKPKDIKEMRCKLSNLPDKLDILESNQLSFYRLANYYENAIIGVNKKIFDKDIIMSCLAPQMVCFREKYTIRTDLLDPTDKAIEEIRKFIENGKNAKEYCKMATQDYWDIEYQSSLTCS